MYTPKYQITDKILNQIVKLEIARKEIRQTILSPNIKKKLIRQMRLEDLYSVGKFLKTDLSREEIKAVFTGKQVSPHDLSIKQLVNYRNAIEFIQAAMHDQYIDLDPNILLHINKVLLTGVTDSWDSGRFRTVNDEVDSKFDSWIDKAKIPNLELDFRTLTYELLNWFKDNRAQTHEILKTGIVLYELYRIAPFPAGNTVTMLATAELLFAYNRYSLGGLFPSTKPFVDNQQDFLEKLADSMKSQDMTVWLEEYTEAVSEQMSVIRDEIYRLQDQKIARRKKKLLGLNERQTKILRYLKVAHKVARIKYMKMYNVSTMTAYRDLKELVSKGLILEQGQGRGTYYLLVRPVEEDFEDTALKTDEEFVEEMENVAKDKPKMVFGSSDEVNLDEKEPISSEDDPFEQYT